MPENFDNSNDYERIASLFPSFGRARSDERLGISKEAAPKSLPYSKQWNKTKVLEMLQFYKEYILA